MLLTARAPAWHPRGLHPLRRTFDAASTQFQFLAVPVIGKEGVSYYLRDRPSYLALNAPSNAEGMGLNRVAPDSSQLAQQFRFFSANYQTVYLPGSEAPAPAPVSSPAVAPPRTLCAW